MPKLCSCRAGRPDIVDGGRAPAQSRPARQGQGDADGDDDEADDVDDDRPQESSRWILGGFPAPGGHEGGP